MLSPPLNNQIKQCIISNTALVACNALVKDGQMRAYWVLIDISTKQVLMGKELFSKEWSHNTARGAEVTVLLDAVKTIQSKSCQMITG